MANVIAVALVLRAVVLAKAIVEIAAPVTPGSPVEALHFGQLRTAIDAVRAAHGDGPSTYSNPITAGSVIRATDVLEMRAFLDGARAALPGIPAIQYTDPGLAAGTAIKAAHIQELRQGVK